MSEGEIVNTVQEEPAEASSAETIKYTEEEIRELVELLNSNILPVRSQGGIDQLLKIIGTLTETTNAIFVNKKFGQEDFQALQPLWDDAWKTFSMVNEIESELKNLGLIGKAIAGIKAYVAVTKLLKAIKAAKEPLK